MLTYFVDGVNDALNAYLKAYPLAPIKDKLLIEVIRQKLREVSLSTMVPYECSMLFYSYLLEERSNQTLAQIICPSKQENFYQFLIDHPAFFNTFFGREDGEMTFLSKARELLVKLPSDISPPLTQALKKKFTLLIDGFMLKNNFAEARLGSSSSFFGFAVGVRDLLSRRRADLSTSFFALLRALKGMKYSTGLMPVGFREGECVREALDGGEEITEEYLEQFCIDFHNIAQLFDIPIYDEVYLRACLCEYNQSSGTKLEVPQSFYNLLTIPEFVLFLFVSYCRKQGIHEQIIYPLVRTLPQTKASVLYKCFYGMQDVISKHWGVVLLPIKNKLLGEKLNFSLGAIAANKVSFSVSGDLIFAGFDTEEEAERYKHLKVCVKDESGMPLDPEFSFVMHVTYYMEEELRLGLQVNLELCPLSSFALELLGTPLRDTGRLTVFLKRPPEEIEENRGMFYSPPRAPRAEPAMPSSEGKRGKTKRRNGKISVRKGGLESALMEGGELVGANFSAPDIFTNGGM
jgi:hypothetical protein